MCVCCVCVQSLTCTCAHLPTHCIPIHQHVHRYAYTHTTYTCINSNITPPTRTHIQARRTCLSLFFFENGISHDAAIQQAINKNKKKKTLQSLNKKKAYRHDFGVLHRLHDFRVREQRLHAGGHPSACQFSFKRQYVLSRSNCVLPSERSCLRFVSPAGQRLPRQQQQVNVLFSFFFWPPPAASHGSSSSCFLSLCIHASLPLRLSLFIHTSLSRARSLSR